jgi:hypothetical protein
MSEKFLTVYLVDRGGDRDTAVNSVINLEPLIVDKKKGTPCTGFYNCSTDWYMILFTDEYLEEVLCNALPYFMQADYDYYNVYRCMDDGESQRYFVSPRLFRKGVILNKQGEPSSDYVGTAILDGFIMQSVDKK